MNPYRIVSIKTTKEHFGIGVKMEDMIGDIVYLNPPNSNNLSFKYKEYTWRYEDVEEIDTTPPNYPAPELFDPSNLIGD